MKRFLAAIILAITCIPSAAYAQTLSSSSAPARLALSNGSNGAALAAGDLKSVTDFGAVGDSTGAHGNGTDNTAAFQAAMNSGSFFVPCGIYRITSTIFGNTTGKEYHISGAGKCAKIFLDATSGVSAMAFLPLGPCPTNLIPCVTIDGINLTHPNNATAGNVALNVAKNPGFTLRNSFVSGHNIGLQITNSYAAIVAQNTFYGMVGSAILSPDTDFTFNNGMIVGNRIYSNGGDVVVMAAAIRIGNSNGGLLVANNDLEGNGAGIVLAGAVQGASISQNYFELNKIFDVYVGGSFSASRFENNRIGSGLTTTLTMDNTLFRGNVIAGPGGTITVAGTSNWVVQNITQGGAAFSGTNGVTCPTRTPTASFFTTLGIVGAC